MQYKVAKTFYKIPISKALLPFRWYPARWNRPKVVSIDRPFFNKEAPELALL